MTHLGARVEPEPGDLTPTVGSQTDVAPLGRDAAVPAHERTHTEDVDAADWGRVAAMDEFKQLVAARIRFIVPATIFFLVYYLALPLLAGFAKDFMDTKVIGELNIAYLFALSQFVMTFVLAYIYLRRASGFDDMAGNIIAKIKAMRGGQ
jgi:uncharacterized membrane protein (DUF485 family)